VEPNLGNHEEASQTFWSWRQDLKTLPRCEPLKSFVSLLFGVDPNNSQVSF
jgi:hypothetical protein